MSAIVLTLAIGAASAADTDPVGRHRSLAAESARAEREQRPEEAVALCRRAVDLLPEGPRSDRCARRVRFLESRRDADGSFAGWTALEQARASSAILGPEATRESVLRIATREGLSPLVAAEASLWLAADALQRRKDPESALRLTAALWPERASLDEDQRLGLVDLHSRALATLGREAEAHAAEAEVKVITPAPRPTPVDKVFRDARYDQLSRAAWAALAVFGLATVTALPRAWRAPPRLWGLAPILLVSVGAWMIAEAWEAGAGRPVLYMGPGFVTVHALGALARPPEATLARRGLVAGLSVVCTLAVAWLALDATSTLGWVGL